MIVDIEKIIIENRIRKDFGNIEELADDIKEYGLINPPVVNKEYRLLAGERRLRACKELGWKQIEVRMMDTRDAEHELNVEISENENRKEFSKAERVDYMRRLMRIESAKARGISDQNLRQNANADTQNSSGRGETRQIVAEQFGISHDTMKKEIEIVDHQDALTPEDFADWDEGRLSTNKAYQKIKQALAAKEERIAELEAGVSKPDMRDRFYKTRIDDLSNSNEGLKTKIVELERSEFELRQQLAQLGESETEIREVEVIPDDYEESKLAAKRFKEQAKTNKAAYDELMTKYTKKCNEALELQDQITDLQKVSQEGLEHSNLSENVFYFCTLANNFVGNVGGLVWLTERIADMPKKEQEMFLKAARALRDFSVVFAQNMERNGYGKEHADGINAGVSLLTD